MKQTRSYKIKKHDYKKYALMIFLALLFVWFSSETDANPIEFVKGFPFMIDFIKRMFPPDFTELPKFLLLCWQTFQIAVVGSVLGTIFAFPFAFLASRNIMPVKVVYQLTRAVLDVFRGISEVIWALIFVAMVGLGPFPGVLALTVHLIGALGKQFSEAIENCDPRIIEAIKSTGASKMQVIFHGIIPELLPLFLNSIFYFFEHNIRAATVLGLVGAGGIGTALMVRIKLFRYNEVLTILILIVIMVIITDRTSAYIRKKLVWGGFK